MAIAARTAYEPQAPPAPEPTPSDSQREAIEAPCEPVLVLAGPGAGKTFCLIERIRFLIERQGIAPHRICAFTFTNKAAGEIAHRLDRTLGTREGVVKWGTIHSFCAELLREFGPRVGLTAGFGIADEEYSLLVLRRLQGPRPWHRTVLTKFSANRFRGTALQHEDYGLLERYERFLIQRRMVDFDMLVMHAAELMQCAPEADTIRARWDAVLVDEFQDLNPVQYRIIRELARSHQHLFAVGDHEQSIYSWAGADPAVFKSVINDFKLVRRIRLEENRRCPRDIFELARTLIARNAQIFDDLAPPQAVRDPRFPAQALSFTTDDAERGWIVDDLRKDRTAHGHDWSEIALLYRTNEMGETLETAFLNAGIPCRLARGRALAEDPVVGYVLAALRVIAAPKDDVHRDAFFATVLSPVLFEQARVRAEEGKHDLLRQLFRMAEVPKSAGEDARQVRRALHLWRNLQAIGSRHAELAPLIQDLLSHRVGRRQSILEERHDELSDPAEVPEVRRLAERLGEARQKRCALCIPPLGGAEIPVAAMLRAIGFTDVVVAATPGPGAMALAPDETPALGFPLAVFKAGQLLESEDASPAFRDFVAFDIETTTNDTEVAEVIDIAAVRMRDGKPVDTFSMLVKPRGRISPDATAIHGISDSDVADAPPLEQVWPLFRQFCGDDMVVAHNGYEFDFRVLKRLVREFGASFDLCTYDTLLLARELFPASKRLPDLARAFGIDTGRSHRALPDARTLAAVTLRLDTARMARARKSALINSLGHLGVALALVDEKALCEEARVFRQITRVYALGRYSGSIELYESEAAGNERVPSVDELIDRLGGRKLMMRIRADKTADDLYPAVMPRLRRLIDDLGEGPVLQQIAAFLERAVLSKWDGVEPERGRVNLLTLHSTKGLEFSRVYVVGVEDAVMPGGTPNKPATKEDIEESRRLLYVGMTRAKERLVLTRVERRDGKPTGGHRFLDEMHLEPVPPS